MKRFRIIAITTAAGLLTACATRPTIDGARDGPPLSLPAGLEQTLDAVPRVETLRIGGPNKPYEIFGVRYVPMTDDLPLQESGLASWYGRKFHGRPTSNGEVYDMLGMTAAHKTMPLPSFARVRNPANGREIIVRINDRGPFVAGRVIDLSYTAALRLDLLRGVAPVEVQRITHAQIRAMQQSPPMPRAPRVPLLAPLIAPQIAPQVAPQKDPEALDRLIDSLAAAAPAAAQP